MTTQKTQDYYRDNPSARWLTLLVFCVGSFLIPLTMSAVPIAIPAIAKELSANAVYVSWIPVSFLLSNLIFLLPAGRLADIYGRKRIYLIGNGLFALASLLAGLAQSIEMLLLFRLLQGVGAAMFFSTGMAIISTVYRDHGRGEALGWVVASVYLGLLCGPLIGGWLSDSFGWRAVFLFPLLPLIACLVLGFFKMQGEWFGQAGQGFDWLGSFLVTLVILLAFAGLSQLTLLKGQVALVLATFCLYGFILHCQRARHPLVPLSIFKGNPLFVRSLISAVLMYSGTYGFVFIMALYLQLNRELSATMAGQLMMVQAVFMVLLAPISGRLSDRFQPRFITTIGCLLNVAGFIVLLNIEAASLARLGFAFALIGLGFGLFSTPNNSTAIGAVDEAHLGIGSSLTNQARLCGQMISTALVSLLLTVYIGDQEIMPEQYPALAKTVQWIIQCSLVFTLVAAFFAYTRGDVNRAQSHKESKEKLDPIQ